MFMILQLCHQRKLHNIKLLCVKKNTTRAAVLASDNSKVSAIIMPSFQPKNSVISKEQQLLEDLKKKEQKADQIHKRILAERQQKAEQNKKFVYLNYVILNLCLFSSSFVKFNNQNALDTIFFSHHLF